jgi:glycosyltransferase involved in cell wall biosynthesis
MEIANPWLTISIPTYNRNEKLRRSVELLLPQLTEGVQLRIFDNGSSTPVTETIKDILASNSQISVFRSKT